MTMSAGSTLARAALLTAVALLVSPVAGVGRAQQTPTPEAGGAQPQRVNAEALLSVQYLRRVEEYLSLHRKLEATMPPLPAHAGPSDVDGHATRLARLIAASRATAKQGDIFPRETRAYFRRQIGRALSGADGPSMRRSIMDENPGKVQLRINGRYPQGIPVTTMPPGILGALPKMPDELEYRFIGKRLILLDVHAQLVVDYIDDAIPG